MTRISVCVGSVCHLCGAGSVLGAFHTLLAKYKVPAVVEVEGIFCQNHCTEGVVVKINDEIITNVSKENVYELFREKVLAGEQL
jgi:NADH:ubiquinone oxidoreductase subunit E